MGHRDHAGGMQASGRPRIHVMKIQPSTMERILKLMAEKKASDVYLSAHAPATIRIDGQCLPVNNQLLPPEAPLQLLQGILAADRIDELLKTGELNTAVFLSGIGNYRVSAMRQRGSYAATIRYIPLEIPRFDTLNLPEVLKRLVMEKRGLVLMVGATGAGKSTTLAAMLDHRNERASGHILTIENPIEYMFSNRKSLINQREVGTDTASLQTALKNALRQAPDVIMIGEIRDRETMTSAIAYAQSGHLCIATLHANNSYQALNRILSFYPVEVRPTLLVDLAATLKSIVSQRLIPATDKGRIPTVEVMLNTELVTELIEKGDFGSVREAMINSIAEGSQTFEADLARLIEEGRIDRKDGLAFADSPTNLMWRLQNRSVRGAAQAAQAAADEEADSGPSFTEITLDVKPSGFGKTGFGLSGFEDSRPRDSRLGTAEDSRLGDV